MAQIYANASSSIEEPKNLEKIITEIDKLDWYEAKEEGLGDLYEGLLEKNANEKKSGAGQYFTPRVLIDVMTELIKPRAGVLRLPDGGGCRQCSPHAGRADECGIHLQGGGTGAGGCADCLP